MKREGGRRPVNWLPERLRLRSILRSVRVWNLSSPPRERRSRTMAVTFPESSQRMPSQVGQLVESSAAAAEGFHESRTRRSGSMVIPFLNSRRDRSSGKEAEEAEWKNKKKRERRERKGFIGVSQCGWKEERHLNDSFDRERETERKGNPRSGSWRVWLCGWVRETEKESERVGFYILENRDWGVRWRVMVGGGE